MADDARFTFFIAHAGKDTAKAEALYDALHPGIPCFLDARDLLPGDEWDLALKKAQRRALATVVLVSGTIDPAYYLREEIASAIAYQRVDPDRHRLVPVYLDGRPSSPDLVPYGLRIKHSLYMAEIGLGGVVAELTRLAAKLQGDPGAAAVSVPAPPPAALSAETLYDALVRLLDAQLETVMFRVAAPRHQLAPITTPVSRRALDLVQWSTQGGAERLTKLRQSIEREAPGILG